MAPPPGADSGMCRHRTNIHAEQKGQTNMHDESTIGLEAWLENGRIALWAHGDGETLVNVTVGALANIIAAHCETKEEADSLVLDVKAALAPAVEEAWKDRPQKIEPADLSAAGCAAQNVMQEA